MAVVKGIYSLTREFPKDEQYGLTSQIRRAAVSIPSNIAEGHARASTKEFQQFLSIALGSMAELETQLIIAKELNLLKDASIVPILAALNEIGKMVRGLKKKLTMNPIR